MITSVKQPDSCALAPSITSQQAFVFCSVVSTSVRWESVCALIQRLSNFFHVSTTDPLPKQDNIPAQGTSISGTVGILLLLSIQLHNCPYCVGGEDSLSYVIIAVILEHALTVLTSTE